MLEGEESGLELLELIAGWDNRRRVDACGEEEVDLCIGPKEDASWFENAADFANEEGGSSRPVYSDVWLVLDFGKLNDEDEPVGRYFEHERGQMWRLCNVNPS